MRSILILIVMCISGCLPQTKPVHDEKPDVDKSVSAVERAAFSSTPAYRVGLAKAARDTIAKCDDFKSWKEMYMFFQNSSLSLRKSAFSEWEQAMTDRLDPKSEYDPKKAKEALEESANAWEAMK